MAEWVRTLDWRPGGPGFESRCGNFALDFDTSVHLALPLSFGGDAKSRRSLLSGVYGSKRSHPFALEKCDLSWTPSLLVEKDNSKNDPVYNTQV